MKASPQFQGSNSSHDLAARCITEAISHGLHVNKEPVYLLLLDAKSAFDLAVIEHAVRCTCHAGAQDEGLLYLDKRLRNIYVEWGRQVMGPM